MAEIAGWHAMLCFPEVATKTRTAAEHSLLSSSTDLGFRNISAFGLPDNFLFFSDL